jgi:hypothetical protein
LPGQANVFDIEFPEKIRKVNLRRIVDGPELGAEAIEGMAGLADVEKNFFACGFAHERGQKNAQEKDTNDRR